MPRYKVLPANPDISPIEVVAPDASCALHSISRLGCYEADVLVDGVYSFSARHGQNGLWTIFHRPEQKGAGRNPLYA